MRFCDVYFVVIIVFLVNRTAHCAKPDDNVNIVSDHHPQTRHLGGQLELADLTELLERTDEFHKSIHYDSGVREQLTQWCLEDHHHLRRKGKKRPRDPVLEATYRKHVAAELLRGKKRSEISCKF